MKFKQLSTTKKVRKLSKKHFLFCFLLSISSIVSIIVSGVPQKIPDIILTPFLENLVQESNKEITLTDLDNYFEDPWASERKRKVKKVIVYGGPQAISRPLAEKIPPGSMLKAVLISGGASGMVQAKSTEPLIINGEEILESESVFVGQANIRGSRLHIQFRQIVFPDGGFKSISAVAANFKDKVAGLPVSKFSSYAIKLGASIGLNFTSGLASGLKEKEIKDGIAIEKNSVENALLNGAKTASISLSDEIMSNLKNKPPVETIKIGTPIYIFFQGK